MEYFFKKGEKSMSNNLEKETIDTPIINASKARELTNRRVENKKQELLNFLQ